MSNIASLDVLLEKNRRWSGVYKFGSPSRFHGFHVLQSHQIQKYEMYHLDKTYEEELFYTLCYFDQVIPYQSLRCSYERTTTGIKLFIHPEDKKFVIYYIALNEEQLITTRDLQVETVMPFLLHGLIHEGEKIFRLCYKHLVKEIPMRYFFDSRRMSSMFDEKSLVGYFHIREHFDKFLVFLGSAVKERSIFASGWRNQSEMQALMKASCNFIYALTKHNTKFGLGSVVCGANSTLAQYALNLVDRVVDGVSFVGVSVVDQTLKCTGDQLMKIYGLIFTNVNYEVFVSISLNNLIESRKADRLREKRIDLCKNFNSNALKKSGRLTKKNKTQLEELKGHYQYMPYRQMNVDSKKETLKGFGLLFLLDGLSLYHCSDELKRKCSVKTSLFTYLKDTIKNGALKHAPLYVPTDDDRASTTCYSDTKYVLPFYDISKQYDLTKVKKYYMKKRSPGGAVRNKFLN
tara:strand:- start:17860 stop:19242 length:1383 start_codon:yes stop_codon:yes gene_type:complete